MTRGVLLQQVKPSNWKQAVAHKAAVSLCGILSVGLVATATVRAKASASSTPAEPPVRFVTDNPTDNRPTAATPTATAAPAAAVISAAGPVADASAGELLHAVAPEPQQVTFASIARPVSKHLSVTHTRHIRMMVTAYCPCKICCGRNAHGVTASGKRVTFDGGKFVAADTDLLPFGTKLSIPGYHDGQAVQVIDTGSAIEGKHIDVFFPTHQQAKQWGVKYVTVTVVTQEAE